MNRKAFIFILLIVAFLVAPANALVYKNFGRSDLASGITSGATSLTVTTGEGSKFPSSGTFRAVLWDDTTYTSPGDDPDAEIVSATLSSGDTFTITRAQEGTIASAWSSGDAISLTLTAGLLDTFKQPRAATFVVVASDASSNWADIADYIADGTADDVQIQAALDAAASLGFGKVLLSDGTFYIAATVTQPVNTMLEGQGIGVTELYAANSLNDEILTNEDQSPAWTDNHETLKGISFNGNRTNQNGAADHACVNYQGVETALTITEIEIHDCDGSGIKVQGSGAANPTMYTSLDTIYSHDNRLFGIYIGYAARMSNSRGMFAYDNDDDGIVYDVSEFNAADNVANGNGGNGIWFRNFMGGTANGITATRNGENGIFAWGVFATTGAGWRANGNNRDNGGYSEIYWGATTDSYGEMRQVIIVGVFTGWGCAPDVESCTTGGSVFSDYPSTTTKAAYGMYFADGLEDRDINIIGFKNNNTATGNIRWPSAGRGDILVVEGAEDEGLLKLHGLMGLVDGVTAPTTVSGWAIIYVDTADGDLKVKFGDGTVTTIATD